MAEKQNSKRGGREIKTKNKKIKLKNLQYEGSRWGRGIYKGKMIEFGGNSSKSGHRRSMTVSLHDAPSCLLGQRSTPSWQAGHPLFGLQEHAHGGEGEHLGSPLGRLGDYGASFPSSHTQF